MTELRRSNFFLTLFTLGTAIFLTLPVLIQDGMFMDAVLYTSVSHNLSLGIGTFWFPQFSEHNIAGLSAFHEQPPLVFGIQSVFFKLFGSSLYVERFYTFSMMLIAVYLIRFAWKLSNPDKATHGLWWLPVLLWITVPVCFWSYSNNMHENTMSVFSLLSVCFFLTWIQKNQAVWLLASGITIFLASFCKGLPGLFTLSAPLLFWLVQRRIGFSKAIFATIILLIVVLVSYMILCIDPDARESLRVYFFDRALHRITETPTVQSRFYIFGRLALELLPMLIVVALVLLRGKARDYNFFSKNGTAWFFVLLGLAGSVPLAFTLVQKTFYLVPALPFFAIGAAQLIAPATLRLISKIGPGTSAFRILAAGSIIVFMAAIIFTLSKTGKTSRNESMLHDVRAVGKIVPRKTVVSIPGELWNRWDLQCYLARYYQISLEKSESREFYLTDRSMPAPAPYQKVDIATFGYELYIREHAHP